ncbi:MAG: hypothetical protein KAX49_01505 [Halanaerobiales bacterium]|nr:hypothetical protein [Halanaerobiales bacterium]
MDHANWFIEANTPCIGCVSPEFPDKMSSFFEHLPDIIMPGIAANTRTIGNALIGAALVGTGVHFTANMISGRFKKHMLDGIESSEVNLSFRKCWTKINLFFLVVCLDFSGYYWAYT